MTAGRPETLINTIDETCRKEARIYRLPHVALLPSFARRVFEKWGIPLSMTRSIAVVFSSSMIRGLGALASGIFSRIPSRVSHPGKPACGKIPDAGPEEKIRSCLSDRLSPGRSL